MNFPLPEIIDHHTENSRACRSLIAESLNNRSIPIKIDYESIDEISMPSESQSSIVYVVSYKGGSKKVLKFFNDQDKMIIEGWVLSQWKKIGLPVPQVYRTGNLALGEYSPSFIELEYLPGVNLQSIAELDIEYKKIYANQMAKILLNIHSHKVAKYGDINVDFSGSFPSLSDSLRSKLPKSRFVAMWGDDKASSWEHSIEILNEDSDGVCITHGDFREGNLILNDGDLSLIDPNPSFNHPYFDLAYQILLPVKYGDSPDANFDLIEEYGADITDERFQSSLMILGSIMLGDTVGEKALRLRDYLIRMID